MQRVLIKKILSSSQPPHYHIDKTTHYFNQVPTLRLLDVRFASLIHILDSIGAVVVFVGGVVRNILMNSYTLEDDVDIELYCVDYDRLRSTLVQHYSIAEVGKSYAVIKISSLNVDICIARKERYIGVRHKDIEVYEDAWSSYAAIAFRRDFTINAMGYLPQFGILLDPYQGIEGLKNQEIVEIHLDNFIRDPLRYLRAFYFASKLNFRVNQRILESAISNSWMHNLPAERIGNEIAKILTTSNPDIGIQLFIQYTEETIYRTFLIYLRSLSCWERSIVNINCRECIYIHRIYAIAFYIDESKQEELLTIIRSFPNIRSHTISLIYSWRAALNSQDYMLEIFKRSILYNSVSSISTFFEHIGREDLVLMITRAVVSINAFADYNLSFDINRTYIRSIRIMLFRIHCRIYLQYSTTYIQAFFKTILEQLALC